jgi:hypothetical protein
MDIFVSFGHFMNLVLCSRSYRSTKRIVENHGVKGEKIKENHDEEKTKKIH